MQEIHVATVSVKAENVATLPSGACRIFDLSDGGEQSGGHSRKIAALPGHGERHEPGWFSKDKDEAC
jgi:hypothetical protein